MGVARAGAVEASACRSGATWGRGRGGGLPGGRDFIGDGAWGNHCKDSNEIRGFLLLPA